MRVVIHNVDHGQCAAITMPNGESMMIDCGVLRNGASYWWPSVHYVGRRFTVLALTNLDEDHLENFRSVMQFVPLNWLAWNPTVNYSELRRLKKDGMRDGVQAFGEWLSAPRNPFAQVQPRPDFGSVSVRYYWNAYTPGVIENTNDLSLVIVIQYGAFKILFSGDLERSGWRRLLTQPDFVRDLIGVNVFVASHHGRDSGCLEEVFGVWLPDIFIISDGAIQYETQETNSWYRNRALGLPVIGTQERRYVLTTRSDGTLQIDVQPSGSYVITPGVYVPTTPAMKIA